MVIAKVTDAANELGYIQLLSFKSVHNRFAG